MTATTPRPFGLRFRECSIDTPDPATPECAMKLLCSSLFALLLVSPAVAAGPIKDMALEKAVRDVLHFPTGELNDEKLKGVFILDAQGKGIKDLSGMEKCPNMAELRLTKNEIVDVKPLAGLTNIQSLDLASNKIKDVAPLAGLRALQRLELSNNEIEKFDSLSGLLALTSLYLTGNKVSDCTPAAKLTRLWTLNLGKNQLKDIAPLAVLTKISILEISENQIADISALSKFTDLSLLMMSKNKVTDLTPLLKACETDAAGPKRFAPYLRLYIGGNPLSDAAKKDQLAALKKIGVRVFEE
jgi:internalin A